MVTRKREQLVEELKAEKKRRKWEKHGGGNFAPVLKSGPPEDPSKESGVAMVTRGRETLVEQVKAAKKVKKEEKQRRRRLDGKLDHRKLEAKLERLQLQRSHQQRSSGEIGGSDWGYSHHGK